MTGQPIGGRQSSVAPASAEHENTGAKSMSRLGTASAGRCAIVAGSNGGAERTAAAKRVGRPFPSNTRF
jgi:hypothetical protein